MKVTTLYFILLILYFGNLSFSQSDTSKIDNVLFGVRCETSPSFPDGEAKLFSFIKLVKIYPEYSKERGVEGKVYIEFVIKKTGDITDIKVLRSPDTLLSQEVIRIFKLMPKWNSGKNCVGDSVDVKMVWPIEFKIDNDPVFQVAETMPEFQGGYSKLFECLGKNIKYSQNYPQNGLTGKFYFEFIIEKDGSISNLKLLKQQSPEFYKHIIFVFNNMPNCEPGKQNGKTVRVKMVLPIGIHWK